LIVGLAGASASFGWFMAMTRQAAIVSRRPDRNALHHGSVGSCSGEINRLEFGCLLIVAGHRRTYFPALTRRQVACRTMVRVANPPNHATHGREDCPICSDTAAFEQAATNSNFFHHRFALRAVAAVEPIACR